MSEKYDKEYFVGMTMLQSDLDVLKRALREYEGNEENVEKAYNLLELIETQETAQKQWNDDDPETERLKGYGMTINTIFNGGKEFYHQVLNEVNKGEQ